MVNIIVLIIISPVILVVVVLNAVSALFARSE